jgi:hypothetical protein
MNRCENCGNENKDIARFCTKCGTNLPVPAQTEPPVPQAVNENLTAKDEGFKFLCPACNQRLEAPVEMIGEKIECPSCGVSIVIPALRATITSATQLTSIAMDGADTEPKTATVQSEKTHGFTKHAFVSHSSKDHALAERICAVLEGFGLSCWIAPRDITPGTPYDEEIVQGIECSQTFILLLSDAANASPHVKRELGRALDVGHAVYPIRIQEVLPGPKLEYLLQGIHWVDAWTPPIETHLDRLAQLITGQHSISDGTRHATELNLPRKTGKNGRVVMAGIAVVMTALAGAWVASTWKEGVISGIASPMPQQASSRLKETANLSSSLSPISSASSAKTVDHAQPEERVVPADQERPQAPEKARDASNRVAMDNQTQPKSKVNQTVTLCWAHDPKAIRQHPSSEQIFDGEGNVIGEVSLDPSNTQPFGNKHFCHTTSLSFKKGKEGTSICVFREDDVMRQTRTGKADGISFSGQIIEIKRFGEGFGLVAGAIETLTVAVTAKL